MTEPSAPTPSHPLAGRWQMKSGSFDGEAIPELVCQNTVLQLAADRYAFLLGEETTDSGSLIWPHGPGTAQLQSEGGPNHGRRLACEITTRGQLLRIVCSIPHPSGPAHPPQAYTALFTRLP
jgi:hypothetical protein